MLTAIFDTLPDLSLPDTFDFDLTLARSRPALTRASRFTDPPRAPDLRGSGAFLF